VSGRARPDVVIADWDYSLGVPTFQRKPKTDPDLRTEAKWPKAPAWLVVSRTPLRRDGVTFYDELLECGYRHMDYVGGWIGGNPEKRRRPCRQCLNQPEKKPPRAVSVEDVANIRIWFA